MTEDTGPDPGFTERDRFAAAALTGLLADRATLLRMNELAEQFGTETARFVGLAAFRYADAMMEARKDPPK